MRRNWPVLLAIVVGAVALVVVAVWLLLPNDEEGEETNLTVALSGPTGSGTGDIRKEPSGWRIDLDADLPRLDDGRYYEAWLRDADGTLVPIGTFNEGEDVVLWAGVSPLEFTTLTVTREKADGDQDSSGDRVLTGEIEEAD